MYTTSTRLDAFPLWLVVLLFLTPAFVAWRLDVEATRWPPMDRCPHCGYDRKGNVAGAVCPECGKSLFG